MTLVARAGFTLRGLHVERVAGIGLAEYAVVGVGTNEVARGHYTWGCDAAFDILIFSNFLSLSFAFQAERSCRRCSECVQKLPRTQSFCSETASTMRFASMPVSKQCLNPAAF